MHQPIDDDDLLTPEQQEQLASDILDKLLYCTDTVLLREWNQRLDAEIKTPEMGHRAWLEGVFLEEAEGFHESESI